MRYPEKEGAAPCFSGDADEVGVRVVAISQRGGSGAGIVGVNSLDNSFFRSGGAPIPQPRVFLEKFRVFALELRDSLL